MIFPSAIKVTKVDNGSVCLEFKPKHGVVAIIPKGHNPEEYIDVMCDYLKTELLAAYLRSEEGEPGCFENEI